MLKYEIIGVFCIKIYLLSLKMSSASGDEVPRPIGASPWPPLGDFHPRPSSFVKFKKSLNYTTTPRSIRCSCYFDIPG